MEIRDVLTKVDNLLVNAIDEDTKLDWLKNIEDKIYKEIVLTHENQVLMTDFSEDNNELIAKSPYDNLYISYIIAQIFNYNFETVRYNNAIITFNQEYQEYANWYNRQNMPI